MMAVVDEQVDWEVHKVLDDVTKAVSNMQGCAPRPTPPRLAEKGLPRPAKKQVLPRPAPPRENWQILRGRAGQS